MLKTDRILPVSITEAIENGIRDGLGKHKSLRAREIENNIKDFIANKACSKDIELDRAFRIFFAKIFGEGII